MSQQEGTILTTDQSGKVRFRERTVHEVAYIVSHSDYATAQELAVPMLGENSIEFVLKPKQRLKGSIVNQEGEAIEGAIIDLKTEANEKMFADWSTQSNRDGEFFWDNAPLMKTFYRIRADGYAPQVAEVTPASSPFEIVLDHPSKAIVEHTIQVLDAETNEPIPTFTYSKVTSWTYQYHTENQGTEGLIFMKAPTDQMTGGISHRETNQYYILARAPGYKSASSRPISIFESKAHSIIKLERAPQKHSFKNVVILAPNGETADRAVVTLVTDNFLSRPFAEYTRKTTPPKSPIVGIQIRADRRGRLPDSGLPLGFRGIAITDSRGALTIPASRLDMTGKTLQLQSLGTVSGTFKINASPMAFHQIYLRAISSGSSLFEYADYTGTDDDGQFTFKNLPPGTYRLFRSDKRLHDSSARQFYPRDIIVRPGATTQVDYHLDGRTVVGRFTSNPSKESINWQEGIYALRKTNIAIPQYLPPRNQQYVTYFRIQEALHRFRWEKERPSRQKGHTYPVEVTPEGEFNITSVPPGDYVLEADILKSVSHSNSRSIQKRLIGQHSEKIEIPNEKNESPINVGEIKISVISTRSAIKDLINHN